MAEAEEEDSGSNIFMLNKPAKAAAKPAEEAPKTEEPVAAAPEPEPEPKPAPAPTEPVAEAEEEDSGSNIFMLNKPAKAAAKPAAEEPKEKEPAAETEAEEPVTVPEGDDEANNDGGSNENIFMLNKPKK